MSIFLSVLKQQNRLDSLHMTVFNVGSRKIEADDDYASKGWQIFSPNLTIYGFDADADACDAANSDLETRGIDWKEVHVPLVLADSIGEAKLHVTQDPMCSSLYPPNESYVARFAGLPEFMNLDFEVEVETTTLDDFCVTENINEIDFLQIDVQGADLAILQGAKSMLSKSILGVQIEVEFSSLYRGQPLFADVDSYMRANGFTLFDLMPARRPRRLSPIYSIDHPGQIVWADAIYFRDLLNSDLNSLSKTPANLFKLACVVDTVGFCDYTLELLHHLTIHYGHDADYNFGNEILLALNQYPNLQQQIQEQGIQSLSALQDLDNFISISNSASQ